MRHANLETKGKESGETILIVNQEEGQIIVTALQKLCELHPRRSKAGKLLSEFENLAVF